jgi:hypothetical protein
MVRRLVSVEEGCSYLGAPNQAASSSVLGRNRFGHNAPEPMRCGKSRPVGDTADRGAYNGVARRKMDRRKIKLMSNEPELRGQAETTINIIDALRGQQEQLKRLVAQPVWISRAPKAALSEMEAQVTELRRLLTQLEKMIQNRLRHD